MKTLKNSERKQNEAHPDMFVTALQANVGQSTQPVFLTAMEPALIIRAVGLGFQAIRCNPRNFFAGTVFFLKYEELRRFEILPFAPGVHRSANRRYCRCKRAAVGEDHAGRWSIEGNRDCLSG